MKLSIIVPVYNVEKYIVKCISSLLDQQTNDYEIIIVNDGTKDKSIASNPQLSSSASFLRLNVLSSLN